MVDLGELGLAARHRLVDMHQPGHAVGVLTLGEGVHLRHRPVGAARLQQAVIDAGIHHLRQHQLRRRRHLLHADRHVLDDVVLARVRELELAEAADPEIDVGEPAPACIVGAVQRARVGARPVARAEGRGRRPRDHALQVAVMEVARRMSAGADPVREDVGVAVDDHASRIRRPRCRKRSKAPAARAADGARWRPARRRRPGAAAWPRSRRGR